MYYGNNNDNNYHWQNQMTNKPRKKKSSALGIVLIFTLIIILIVMSGGFLYIKTTDKFAEYDSLINEYKNELENYEKNIADLNSQISGLSNFANNLGDDLSRLSDVNTSSNSNLNNLTDGLNISDIAAKVSPSVIGIRVDVPSQNVSRWYYTSPIEATGSGIILTEDGYIVTNYHVVSYAVTYGNAIITVVLSDETEYVAKYIGGDEINDLAIIKVTANNLPYATLGSSDDSKVGDFVIAIGNPLGINLYGSVTLGIISGVNRKIEAENVAEKLIQTDAAINPGNSGGALLNMNGEVIGINTVKISRSNVEGIGFAIPMDYAKPLIDSIIQYGYVKGRPTIGVSGFEITSSMARMYGVPKGLYVENIDFSSGAANAGINEGDIITKIGDVTVYSLNDIANIVKNHKVGEKITATIWRGGNYFEVEIVLTEQT